MIYPEPSIFQKTPATEAAAQRCSVKTGVLKNFVLFTGKHVCQSLFFNKVADLNLYLY